MPLPQQLAGRLAIPAIVAPMFLVSGPDLVVECCRAGLLGTFPALNQRTTYGFAAWLDAIEARLTQTPGTAPYGVNLIVHRSNPRVEADLARIVQHRVPLVITSLGAVPDVVAAVHSYGGLVFHDVTNLRHAEKAIAAGVDGIVAVAAGAGGHAGTLSPFALVAELRAMFDGTIVLSGAMSEGRHIAAAEVMGADLAYLGTHFITAAESMASPEQKAMMLASHAADIVYTDTVSGIPANFLGPSLAAHQGHAGALDLDAEAKAWRDVWSAGHGVGGARAVRAAAEIAAELIAGYRVARTACAIATTSTAKPIHIADRITHDAT
ncbi:NAD(P)H-dependent flavin oxidoreductase [Sphingomonas nostoxanthinifaciens]|uniref:NAD(P)H-dependent flavin oxidoreductase n=1 Tax=Sphingomonas nostoxanthinifaciens TaxID=2872652 RepID=UPI001CC2075C|nr:nitronate monooxygenase [Sphingomonas nostoxanthinifaciens]UAK24513.1 nitronate monooxygenase [Sphingomonas nostoxanthinifaciens]